MLLNVDQRNYQSEAVRGQVEDLRRDQEAAEVYRLVGDWWHRSMTSKLEIYDHMLDGDGRARRSRRYGIS